MSAEQPKILCVDSDRTTGEWITNEMRTSSPAISLSSVEGGRSALKLLYREAFDLCVIDYALPDMTGAQLCLLVRQIGYGVPIMMFTAMNRRIDREKAAAAGANEFLTKPDDLDMFSPAARRLIGMRRAICSRDETISSLTNSHYEPDMQP
jgi:DNA-binding response OmpR family regulator